MAASAGYTEIVELLIDAGVGVDTIGSSRETALVGAVRAGHRETVELLYDKGADVNRHLGSEKIMGPTALQVAIENGNKKFVEFLLAKGADPNARGLYSENMLHSAVSRGNVEIVELLLAKGAKVPDRDEDRWELADRMRELGLTIDQRANA
jgi:ankyrin repeat protein